MESGRLRSPNTVLIAVTLVLMITGALIAPSRSVQSAKKLVREGRLFRLTVEERSNLTAFLTALGRVAGTDKPFGVNEPYSPRKINVYVVDGQRSGLSLGNAAYASDGDTLFIDAFYFRFGDQKVFEQSKNSLTGQVLAPLRVRAYLVLAHEIGHRQLHRAWWPALVSSAAFSHAREIEADDFSIQSLKQIYSSDVQRNAAAIPGPASSLLTFGGGEPSPLQRLADHLGFSIAFQSEELLDSPFPMLSETASHPAYFERQRRLLDSLQKDAQRTNDEAVSRQVRLAATISKATEYVYGLHPAEIEFDHAIQFVFLDNSNLYVVGSDNREIVRLPLSRAISGRVLRQKALDAQPEATVRYAWAGREGEAITLRRDGTLAVADLKTGHFKSSRVLSAEDVGDQSCVKRILLPPGPAAAAYLVSCIKGAPRAASIDLDGHLISVDLRSAALTSLAKLGQAVSGASGVRIAGLDLSANGMPTLHFAADGAVFSATLSPELQSLPARRLSIAAQRIPEPTSYRGAILRRQLLLSDSDGRSYFLAGSEVFRKYRLYDAGVSPPREVGGIDLTPSVGADVDSDVYVRDTHQLSGDRLIVNLERGGVYLVDFGSRILAPLSRIEFSNAEQIMSNVRGDWVLFRKSGTRVLLFKQEGEVERP